MSGNKTVEDIIWGGGGGGKKHKKKECGNKKEIPQM
jgi:hypothetical protein